MAEVEPVLTRFGPSGDDTPLLSVLMITYNHARYIRKALESILGQRTPFGLEIVVGEDCSSDDTREIVRSVAATADVPITLIERPSNVGMVRNFADTLASCRGAYVAMLEGDDWWSDPHKLERQVRVLESDPGLAFCFHRVRWIKEADGTADWEKGSDWPLDVPNPVTFEAIAGEVFVQTGSVVFRRSMLPELAAWTRELPWLDWILFLQLAANGGVSWLPDVMSAYRQHGQGATAGMRTIGLHRSAARMFELLPGSLPHSLHPVCRRMRMKHLRQLATEQEVQGRTAEACRTMSRVLWAELRTLSVQRRTLVWVLRLAFPRLHRISVRLRGST